MTNNIGVSHFLIKSQDIRGTCKYAMPHDIGSILVVTTFLDVFRVFEFYFYYIFKAAVYRDSITVILCAPLYLLLFLLYWV